MGQANHSATILWQRADARFSDGKYSRGHRWIFDGGIKVPGSSSPASVPVPLSVEAAVDPEEGLLASLSSCHMLWFLAIAAKRGFVVDEYRDNITGELGKNAEGKVALLTATLHPAVRFSGERLPTHADIDSMHHESHEKCMIANSIRTEVRCESIYLS